MVITFGRHPREVICPDWHPQLLSTPKEKAWLLLQTGVDRLVVLDFDKEMSLLSARAFMEQVLAEQLGVRLLLTGYDNHFGHREKGVDEGFAEYVGYGRELGIDVVGAEPLADGSFRFSSSLARRLLAEGDVAGARHCLGRPYSLVGTVVHGRQIGRQMGFPTANVVPDNMLKIVPRAGVYAVMVSTDYEQGQPLQGMMNIGRRPTFDGLDTTLEVHLFDYEGNLYGHTVTIDFMKRLRDEQHFDSPDELALQMRRDEEMSRRILNNVT